MLTLATALALYVKCPQEPNDPVNFSAPLVPLLQTISLLANFYLSGQISHLVLGLILVWIALICGAYFVYGYSN